MEQRPTGGVLAPWASCEVYRWEKETGIQSQLLQPLQPVMTREHLDPGFLTLECRTMVPEQLGRDRM